MLELPTLIALSRFFMVPIVEFPQAFILIGTGTIPFPFRFTNLVPVSFEIVFYLNLPFSVLSLYIIVLPTGDMGCELLIAP